MLIQSLHGMNGTIWIVTASPLFVCGVLIFFFFSILFFFQQQVDF